MAPVLANGEWIQAIVPIVIFVIWIVSQVVRAASGNKGVDEPQVDDGDDWDDDWAEEEVRPGRRQAGPVQPQAGPNAPPAGSDPISAEIEAFLRKVRGEPEAPAPQPPTARTPQRAEPVVAQPAEARRPSRPVPVEATVVEARPARSTSPTTREDRFSWRDSDLASDVEQADERVEAFDHEAFNHEVGQLHDTSAVTDAADGLDISTPSTEIGIPTSADEYRDFLASPESIRQAIVLNEILTRPTNRW